MMSFVETSIPIVERLIRAERNETKHCGIIPPAATKK